MAFTGSSDGGVWRRLYLAVLSWILIGDGGLAALDHLGLGWRLAGPWVPVALGVLGLTAAAIGPRSAQVALIGISGLLVVAGALRLIEAWLVMGIDSLEVGSAAALLVAGVAGLWLAWVWSVTRTRRSAQRSGAPTAKERWWQTRWWLLLVVTTFPFVLGITASLASVVTAAPFGCEASAQRALADHAGALATRISGLHLGEPGGCDSGDPAYIGWEHASLDDLVASASAAGCRDAYVEDWDDEYHSMVCDQGPAQLLLSISLDPEAPGVTGELSFDR